MNLRLTNVFCKVTVFLLVGILCAFFLSQNRAAGPELVAKTREVLRQQGFKTDLSQFDFSTSPEMRTRQAPLTSWVSNRTDRLPRQWPDLAETVSNDSVVVVWKQDTLKWPHALPANEGDQVTWDEFRELFEEHQAALDAACQAALGGSIRFNLEASHGHFMLIPHVATMRNLVEILGSRTMLALHDGQQDAAWTNWVAATRLVTAWDPEPAEFSHLARFAMTKLLFESTWQALQTNGWPEKRLAQLQAEWEAADLFSQLPEIGEFDLASDAADYELERRPDSHSRRPVGLTRPTLIEFIQGAFRSPWGTWSEMRYHWNETHYLHGGQYEEEREVLLYDGERELELRNAVRASTWAQMSRLPGVTNPVPFPAKHYSRAQAAWSSRNIATALQEGGGGLLGQAAQAEARRRILIAALALERYHMQHGAYPTTLASLAPEFLKTEPADFMDGRPLRYQLNGDGHYRLYSVGLDCVDDGGRMTKEDRPFPVNLRSGGVGVMPKGDIVWPFPASTTVVATLRRQKLAIIQNRADDSELALAQTQWKHAANHQADVEKLLAAPASILKDVKYQGQPVSELLGNTNTAGANHLKLRDMFTLQQIMTGREPEEVMFELPVSFDASQRVGELYLLIDTNNDNSDEGCVVQQMNCRRADNGDCLVVWDTIYESPGKHALRAAFEIHGGSPDNETIVGPPFPIVVSNLCQFSLSSAHFDPRLGAAFQIKLPELNGRFLLRCQTTNGLLVKTITGATTNGIVSVRWDLADDQGRHRSDDAFDSIWTITLPDSGRTQNLRGP